MTDTHALAMLALRRVHGRIAVMAGMPSSIADETEADATDPTSLTGGDRAILARVLRRAVDRAWLTLELLFCRAIIAPRLGRGGAQTLENVFGSRCFQQLSAMPAPFRQTIARELHVARKGGPLAPGDIEVEDLLRQLAALTRPTDQRALQDLEWYALWQMAAELSRDGYRELRSLFEARSETGDSLLVGLVTSFIPFELELEGQPPRIDLGLNVLSGEHVRWLCEQSEPLEVLLNEARGENPSAAPDEGASHVRQGLVFAQKGEYERAIIEFTAAIQSDLPAAAPYVHRGDALRHRGEYDRAIADYTQALRLEPNNLLATLNRGLVHRLVGRSELAVADLSEALRLDPRNVVAYNGRGGAHADLGEYADAIADHTHALRLDPSLAWAYQSRGDAYASLEEYDRAIADYTQALRLNPHFPLAHANRGDAYRLAGDLDRAAVDYTEALRLDPLNPRTFTSRGDTYRRQERYDLALADYGEAIRLDPTNPTGYLNRGIAYQLAGDYDRAVANFNHAERFDADNPEVFYQRALAHQHQESYREAISDLGRVLELNPRDSVAYVSRGTLYSLTRQFDQAISDFTEAIRLDPRLAQARMERGRVHAMQGAFAEALDDCAAAIRIDGHLVPALLIRGGVLIRLGEYENALLEFNRAIRTNPRYARAFNDRGVAYSKLGRYEEAIRDFSKAIEIVPEDAQALANRGNAYQLLERSNEALSDYTQAVVIDQKYAAMYCVLRGQVEARRGHWKQALADFAIATVIEPKNRLAKAAQATAQQQLESSFEVAPAPIPQIPVAPASEGVIELSDAIVEEEAKPVARSAADTHLALPPMGAEDTHPALPVSEEPEAMPTERAQFDAEQKHFQDQERLKRLQALEEKAAEIRKRNEAEEAAKKAKYAKYQKKEKRDPEQESAIWRKRKQYAVLFVFGLVVAYYGGQLIWSLIPPSKQPYKELAADRFAEEYAKDPAAADEKFAEQVIVVRGKVKIVREQVRKGQIPPPPKVFFEVPTPDKISVECLFDDPDIVNDLRADSEYLIAGRVQKFKAGAPVTLKQATIKEGPTAASAAQPTMSAVAMRSDSLIFAHDSARLHAKFSSRSRMPKVLAVEPPYVHSRVVAGRLWLSFQLARSYS
jgi:tetratricopeptide (TPR) repeat protein